jgi:hypothetical protein
VLYSPLAEVAEPCNPCFYILDDQSLCLLAVLFAADVGKERPGVLRLAGIIALLEWGLRQCILPDKMQQHFGWQVTLKHLDAAMAVAQCCLDHRNIIIDALRRVPSPVPPNPRSGRGSRQQQQQQQLLSLPEAGAVGPSQAANYDEVRYPHVPTVIAYFK